MAEPVGRPVSFWAGCFVGAASAACGVAAWTVTFVALPDDDGYPVAVWTGIIVGVAVLIANTALALGRPRRPAPVGLVLGVTALILATIVFKILVVDYP
jgi:hypothetical protein